jgi:hypothetical protein
MSLKHKFKILDRKIFKTVSLITNYGFFQQKSVRRSPLISDFGPHSIPLALELVENMEGTVMKLTCHFLDIMSLHDVLVIIFEYLRIEEVGQLERSLTTSSRKVFLDSLSKHTFARIVDELEISCLDWLNKRGARMLDLVLRSPNVKYDELIQIFERCPHMEHLDVSRLTNCNDLVLMALACHCRELRSFKVDLERTPRCEKFGEIMTVTGIRSLLLSSPLLECCRIAHAPLITSSDLNQIAQATSTCKFLKDLSFSDCSPFPFEGLLTIAWNCRNLESLAFDCEGDVNIFKLCNVLSVQAPSLRSLKFAAMRCAEDNGQVRQALRFVQISPCGVDICTHPRRHYDSSERITVDQSPPSHGISVVDLNGDTRALLQMEPFVATIQSQIYAQTGIRPYHQRLVHCGRLLNPTGKLTDHSSITLFVNSIKVRQLFRFKRFF